MHKSWPSPPRTKFTTHLVYWQNQDMIPRSTCLPHDFCLKFSFHSMAHILYVTQEVWLPCIPGLVFSGHKLCFEASVYVLFSCSVQCIVHSNHCNLSLYLPLMVPHFLLFNSPPLLSFVDVIHLQCSIFVLLIQFIFISPCLLVCHVHVSRTFITQIWLLYLHDCIIVRRMIYTHIGLHDQCMQSDLRVSSLFTQKQDEVNKLWDFILQGSVPSLFIHNLKLVWWSCGL